MPSFTPIARALATPEDRRGAAVALGIVAAVVAVLGFGSGTWGEIARSVGASAAPAGRDLGTVVQPAPAPDAGGSVAVGVQPGRTGGLAAPVHPGVVTTVASSTTQATTLTTAGPTTTAAATPPVVAASCSAGVVAPFWIHFEKAHLETSPGQQVADALDLDQYIKTHTVLLEAMLVPLIEAVLGTPEKPGAFWTHFEKAHLETSPGQQVADALDLDQYVKTHTVLVEDMLNPIVGAC